MTDISRMIAQHDPLPEASWRWRRFFTIAVTAAVMWFIWIGIDRLAQVAVLHPKGGIPALASLLKWLLLFNAMMVTYYMVAPSAEQIVKLIQTASLFKGNVQFASRSVEEPSGKSEVASTIGKPPQPIAPEVTSTPPNMGKKETQVLE